VSAVNIQENNQRCPINYITPPGVREQLFNNNTIINIVVTVSGEGLELGDSRAVFKNVSIDMRQLKTENVFAC
jgi:cell surface protein SprA